MHDRNRDRDRDRGRYRCRYRYRYKYIKEYKYKFGDKSNQQSVSNPQHVRSKINSSVTSVGSRQLLGCFAEAIPSVIFSHEIAWLQGAVKVPNFSTGAIAIRHESGRPLSWNIVWDGTREWYQSGVLPWPSLPKGFLLSVLEKLVAASRLPNPSSSNQSACQPAWPHMVSRRSQAQDSELKIVI